MDHEEDIKVSTGKPLKVAEDDRPVIASTRERTFFMLMLLCRHRDETEPGELGSPWHDRPEVVSGKITKAAYIEEIARGIDNVGDGILRLVREELLHSDRTIKPSVKEVQVLCAGAMRIEAETLRLQRRAVFRRGFTRGT